ncbi:hypothetical protein GPECTOR_8g42 [Gonium pectorale]|uniref:Uncharacterized protein n=1 Tax=Gonium pectorale TaxID=33097 RepID=A0A150GT64_GONPE|nr:hypothetical protein GPECTOR_8g42 [Gonium pectorale]|eukprot:KXZ53047.1 hypothetical protein GPECTOR_8g42 [Gonium pectorale]
MQSAESYSHPTTPLPPEKAADAGELWKKDEEEDRLLDALCDAAMAFLSVNAPGVQHQPRGVATLRLAAAAATSSGSALWSAACPRVDMVAVDDPDMKRTLDAILVAEDLVVELMERAIEVARQRVQEHEQQAAEALRRATTGRAGRRAAAQERGSGGEEVAATEEEEQGPKPGCQCTIS